VWIDKSIFIVDFKDEEVKNNIISTYHTYWGVYYDELLGCIEQTSSL